MIWLAFALMTTATVLALVWPLASRRHGSQGPRTDVRFYAGLLQDVDGDIARGLVSPADADVTRAEIGRRLLTASRSDPAAGTASGRLWRRLAAIAAAVLVVPALSLALYVRIGNPSHPDEPAAARGETPSGDFAAAVAKIQAHLIAHPDDGRGFEVLAPVLLRMGRPEDAVSAYRAAVRLLGDTAEREAALGQALMMAADGVVTADARAVFDKALALDPRLPQARFFVALAAEQDGDKVKATALWEGLLADTPRQAPWRASVEQHVAATSGRPGLVAGQEAGPLPPGALPSGVPSGPAAAAIVALPSGQQQQMIRGMVDGLATRLAQNGRDVEGWLRLIRAYTVLGDGDKARKALADAQRELADDPSALARINAAAQELGVER